MGLERATLEKIRFLADQNFRQAIIAGLRQRQPAIEVVLARDVGLQQQPDSYIMPVSARSW